MNTTSGAHALNLARLAALGGLAGLLALFLGWQAGETVVSADPPPARVAWRLPALAEVDSTKELAVLTARKPWGEETAAGPVVVVPGAARPLEWRLAGVVERPDGVFALIAIGKSGPMKYEYREVGGKLPDGSTVVKITNEYVKIRSRDDGDDERVLWLFRGAVGSVPTPAFDRATPSQNRRSSLSPRHAPLVTVKIAPAIGDRIDAMAHDRRSISQ